MPVSTEDPIFSLRRQLAAEITRSLGPGSQHVVAPSYGIPQPRMSELERGIVNRCSIEWLIRRINRLGGSVSIHVTLGDAGREWQSRRLQLQRARRLGMHHPARIGGMANVELGAHSIQRETSKDAAD
ncbi:MAG TPA: XRE family transcriptional regulator [Gemmatimonadaceae bacterium]